MGQAPAQNSRTNSSIPPSNPAPRLPRHDQKLLLPHRPPPHRKRGRKMKTSTVARPAARRIPFPKSPTLRLPIRQFQTSLTSLALAATLAITTSHPTPRRLPIHPRQHPIRRRPRPPHPSPTPRKPTAPGPPAAPHAARPPPPSPASPSWPSWPVATSPARGPMAKI